MSCKAAAQRTIQFCEKRIKNIDWHYKLMVVLIVISYITYLPKHMGNDSWMVQNMYYRFDQMQSGHWEAILGEAMLSGFQTGRFARGTLFIIFAVLRKARWLVHPWVNWAAIALFCMSGCKMWQLIKAHANDQCKGFNIMYICCLISICQPFFTDWMQFIECQLYYPFALWLAIYSAAVLYDNSKKLTIKRWCIASVLLILSAGFYQIALQYFVLLSVSVTLLSLRNTKSAAKTIKNFFKYILIALAAYASAAAIQLTFLVIFNCNRIHSNSLSEIAIQLNKAQRNLWKMVPYTGNRLSSLFFIAVIVLAVWCVLRIIHSDCAFKVKIIKLIFSIVGFAGYYTAIFLPLIVSELWFPQRSLVGFWGIPLVVAAAGCKTVKCKEMFWAEKALCMLLCILLLSNIYSCIVFGTDLHKVNAIDEMRGRFIFNSILKYEQESQTVVKKVAFCKDKNPTYVYHNIHNSHENNQAAWGAEWNYLSILEIVSGRTFEQCDYPNNMFFERYGNADWDFIDEEQIFFEAETAYIAVY